MDLNQINCFISVARTLNFSEAARRNFVSQSTVSRYIGELEKEFGVKLFTRSRRDVMLTDEGKTLLPYAVEITESIKKARSVISRMHKGGVGKISITFDAASGAFAKKCLKKFSSLYPDIAVELQELGGRESGQIVTDSAYDFHFMLRDMLPENNETRSIITHRESLSIVCPVDFAFNKESIQSLQGERFILLSEKENPILYMEIMDVFRTCHLSPAVSCYDSVKAVLLAVASGLGISVLPTGLVRMQSGGDIKSYEIDMLDTSLTFVAAYRKELSNPAACLFLDIIRELSTGRDEGVEYVL